MGSTNYSSDAYSTFSSTVKTKTRDELFSDAIHKDMNPMGVTVREARDSDNHPTSLAIGVFLDETGSMGDIPEKLLKEKMGALIETLMNNGVDHPAVLFGGIGDHYSDRSPLQVGQFESGTDELIHWLQSLYLEGMGGGQNMESYSLAWLFFAEHTSIDCFEKRGQKGFLFTIGDEAPHKVIEAAAQNKILGTLQADDRNIQDLLDRVSQMYEVFHIHIEEGSYPSDSSRGKEVLSVWRKLLGERVLLCDNYQNVAEIIASTVAMTLGTDLSSVLDTLTDDSVRNSVSTALMNVSQTTAPSKKNTFDSISL